jgi:SagB-type dehydrogenase family enzyme
MSSKIDIYWETKKSPLHTDRLWELYHENSKNRKLGEFEENKELVYVLHTKGSEGHQFIGKKRIPLPKPDHLSSNLGDAITTRRSVRGFKKKEISLKKLSTLLYAGYGIQSAREGLRSARNSPSAGKLYPLEIYICARKIKGLDPGLYHYNPFISKLEYLKAGDHTGALKEIMILDPIVEHCAGMIFITAVFERTAIKYEERGYRYALIETGHLAQNINLAATALKLGVLNIGGFFDTKANDYLETDGVEEAALYMIAFGHKNE